MRLVFIRKILILSLMMLLCFLAGASAASAWWNESWDYRKKISLDTTGSGADIKANLSEATLLMRLHSGNFNFANAADNGNDLRFVSSDGGRVLEHHIETYNALEELAFIWVKVPVLSGSSTQHIWMYYGNPEAGPVQDTGKTFDAHHVGVYHFAETEGPPQDKTAYGNHASKFSVGQGFPASVGNGVAFNGSGDRILIPYSPSMEFSSGLTFSAWIKLSGPVEEGYLFADRGGEKIAVAIDGSTLYSRVTTAGGRRVATERSAQVPVDAWHHVAVTFDPGERLSIYLDGTRVAAAQFPGDMPALKKEDLVLGASGGGANFYAGEMDEARISKIPRSEDWLRAMYFSQGPEDGLIQLGSEEVAEGGGGIPIFYLGTIFQNITLEGWLIIGILIFLGMLSMLVLLTKAFFLQFTQRENRDFIEEFNKIYEDPVCLYSEASEEEFQNSTLYAVYSEGCKDLMGWIDHLEANGFEGTMMSKAVNSMKSALERRYLRESQRLNAWLVIMTSAISGGPFLGLLGTVWGVMNTFAAMALAGEANLMAIAPGVASALSTTVFGLLVAIPSLFGYNYLLNKIKNITADMNIFVDQFTIRIEEMIYKG